MELSHRFTVPVPIDTAWDAFNDLDQIAPCFPGAALASFDGERFEGWCKVKLGPVSLQYTGSGRFVERDEKAKRAVIEAKGKDKRGNGTAAAAVTAQLTASGSSATEVEVTTDLKITGRPAQFGRGVMQEVSDKLLAQFTACLETKLGSGVEDEPASPLSVVGAPPSAAEVAAVADAGGERRDRRTPIAAEAEEAVRSSSASTPGTSAARAPAARAPASEPPRVTELDLGATVLPVLLKRYAPYIVAAIVVLWGFGKVLRNR